MMIGCLLKAKVLWTSALIFERSKSQCPWNLEHHQNILWFSKFQSNLNYFAKSNTCWLSQWNPNKALYAYGNKAIHIQNSSLLYWILNNKNTDHKCPKEFWSTQETSIFDCENKASVHAGELTYLKPVISLASLNPEVNIFSLIHWIKEQKENSDHVRSHTESPQVSDFFLLNHLLWFIPVRFFSCKTQSNH